MNEVMVKYGENNETDIHENGDIRIRERSGEAHIFLVELPKEYKDTTIETDHMLQGDWFDTVYTVEYKNGVDTQTDIVTNYMCSDFEAPEGYKKDQISDRIIDLVSRFDKKIETDEGIVIDHNLGIDITVEFKLDDKYKVIAKKMGALICISVEEMELIKCPKPIVLENWMKMNEKVV